MAVFPLILRKRNDWRAVDIEGVSRWLGRSFAVAPGKRPRAWISSWVSKLTLWVV